MFGKIRSGAVAAGAVLVGLCSACASSGPYTWVNDLRPEPPTQASLIQPRDVLAVNVVGQPTLSGEFTVRDDGALTAPLVGSVPMAGLTPTLAGNALAQAWKKMVVDPAVTVTVAKHANPRVNVVGEVKTPGVFELVRDHTVLAALAAAGWVTDFASNGGVYVVRRDRRMPRVRFRISDITAADPKSAAFQLNDGDSVVVE